MHVISQTHLPPQFSIVLYVGLKLSQSALEQYPGPLLFEVLLADPHLEGLERRDRRTADPAGPLPVARRRQSDDCVSWHQLLQGLVEPLIEACQHSRAAGDDNRIIQRLPDVDIAVLDRVDDHFVDAGPLETNLIRTEQDLGCTVLLRAKLDD